MSCISLFVLEITGGAWWGWKERNPRRTWKKGKHIFFSKKCVLNSIFAIVFHCWLTLPILGRRWQKRPTRTSCKPFNAHCSILKAATSGHNISNILLFLLKGNPGKPGADGVQGEPGIGGSRVSVSLYTVNYTNAYNAKRGIRANEVIRLQLTLVGCRIPKKFSGLWLIEPSVNVPSVFPWAHWARITCKTLVH